MVDKVKQGKKNRASGSAFELRVRKDLEEKGWIVDKWSNNVELPQLRCIQPNSLTPREHEKLRNNCQFLDFNNTMVKHDGRNICENHHYEELGKLIPAKRKYLGPGSPMAIGTGFPDFIAFRSDIGAHGSGGNLYSGQKPSTVADRWEWTHAVIGVESKSNGKLDRDERMKCRWLLENKIFNKILIAEKIKVKNKIVVIYKDFLDKHGE